MFKKWHLLHVQQMCWAHCFFAQRRFLMTNDPDKLLYNFRTYYIFLHEEYKLTTASCYVLILKGQLTSFAKKSS